MIHDLHTAVHSRFLEAGIEISYPQRDLHIRSWPPGLEASLHERSNGAATK